MKRRRNTVLQVLEDFRNLSPEVILTDLVVFLYVCENEGINVSELAQVAKLTEATASRRSRALAPQKMPGAISPALGLVEAFAGEDARQRLLFLTPAGRELRNRFADAIANPSLLVGVPDIPEAAE
jgi:DNA-binding MarR family transcriptional regulator